MYWRRLSAPSNQVRGIHVPRSPLLNIDSRLDRVSNTPDDCPCVTDKTALIALISTPNAIVDIKVALVVPTGNLPSCTSSRVT
jgi:hypothetical protein